MGIKKTLGSSILITVGIFVIIAGIVCFLAIKFSSIIIFAFALPALIRGLVSDGGLNHWMAQIIAVGFTVVLMLASFYIIRSSTSLGTKILRLLLLVLFIIAAYSYTIYGLQQGEIRTKIAQSVDWDKTQPLSFKRVRITTETALFDPITDKPCIWYYKHENGKLDVYSNPGTHPGIGVKLKAMDFETAKLIRYYFATGQAEKMINNDINYTTKPVKTSGSKYIPVKKIAVVAKESPTRLARKQIVIELEQFKSFICGSQQNP